MSIAAKCICGRCLYYCNPSLEGCLNLTYLPEPDPRVTQLLEAAREAKDVLEEIAYNGDLKPLQEDKLRNLSSALKPFEK